MASSLPLQLAETVQTAHLRHDPSAERDLAPSTAADTKEPVVLEALDDEDEHDHDEHDIDDDDDDEFEREAYSVIRPWQPGTADGRPARDGARQGRPHLPPLPDLRFEQSYLHSLAAADGVWWKIALITARDQVLMPLVQGVLYNLAVAGWQHWNRTASLGGRTVGSRVRRWWYGVNNWPVPALEVEEKRAAAAPARRQWLAGW